MGRKNLRFAVLGTGFWSKYQIPAWFEVGGVELVALYNRTRAKAEATAKSVVAQGYTARRPRVYDDPQALFDGEDLDFVDIITEVPAHALLVLLAAEHRVPVICQKPMAPDYETASRMVGVCRETGTPFFVHENFRWQTPIRALKQVVDSGQIGAPFRAHIRFVFCKPFVFENQPMLKHLEHLALTDVGSHLFDLARFFFGEPQSIYCQTYRTREDIVGEDVASAVLRLGDVTCICEMSYSTRTELEQFPQPLFYIEGNRGTAELSPDFYLRITTDEGTLIRRAPPPKYAWADPDYAVVHASIVPCNADLLAGIKGEKQAETTGEDNLKTMRLVYSAYESAERNAVVPL